LAIEWFHRCGGAKCAMLLRGRSFVVGLWLMSLHDQPMERRQWHAAGQAGYSPENKGGIFPGIEVSS
jgi:hypothetical protein